MLRGPISFEKQSLISETLPESLPGGPISFAKQSLFSEPEPDPGPVADGTLSRHNHTTLKLLMGLCRDHNHTALKSVGDSVLLQLLTEIYERFVVCGCVLKADKSIPLQHEILCARR